MRKAIGNGRILLEGLLLLVVRVGWVLPTPVTPADAQRYAKDIKIWLSRTSIFLSPIGPTD
jgi:hypothetical protein